VPSRSDRRARKGKASRPAGRAAAAGKTAPRKARPASDKALKPGPGRSDNSGGAVLGAVPLAEIRRLIRLVQRTGIGELEVSSGGRSVRISTAPGTSAGVGASSASGGRAPSHADGGEAYAPASPAAPAKAEAHAAITSPMVGTFYRAPAPDADPYVEVGDLVEVGQTICIVEAMKLMNEIESEVRGRIVKIQAENAQPVEFGQTLFLVEPA
jgi:oxaloacetate decarboxylase alpha subunit